MWKDDGGNIFKTEDDARDDLWNNFDLYEDDILEFLKSHGIYYFNLIEAILTGSNSQISEIREAIEDALNYLFNKYYSEIEEE